MTKSLPALLLLSLMAGALFAQNQPQPLISVALWKVAPAKEADFVTKAKAFNPVLDKLLADGSIVAYGMDVDMLHVPGNTNVSHWYTAPNVAGIQAAETAIDAFISANPQVMEAFDAHDAKRSAPERDMLAKLQQSMVTRAGHRDMLSKAVIPE